MLWDYNVWFYTRSSVRCFRNRNATLLISRWTRSYMAVKFLSMCLEAVAVKAHLFISSPPDGSFQCLKLLSFISSVILFRGCWGTDKSWIPEHGLTSENFAGNINLWKLFQQKVKDTQSEFSSFCLVWTNYRWEICLFDQCNFWITLYRFFITLYWK